jgi:ABC transporter, phosphonate, periplasmic substrate-binding protein
MRTAAPFGLPLTRFATSPASGGRKVGTTLALSSPVHGGGARIADGGGAFSRRIVLAGMAAVATAASTRLRAADARTFYRGRTLTVLVGFAPGGGVDTTARVVARHFVRFVPGTPNVIVQNMEGAAGAIAANHLYTRVAPDGLTLAIPGRSWFIEGVVKSPGIRFDPAKLSYVGSPGAVNSVFFVRTSTGVTSFADLKASKRPLTFGALASNTATAMVPALLANNGVPIKVVAGYGSSARILIALEQGEVDGFYTVEDTFARRKDLIDNKIVIPILQYRPDRPGLPVVRDVLPESTGKLLHLVMALESLGLPLVGPPGMPEDRLEALRNAFTAMAMDAEYRADALRVDMPVGAALDGQELAAMMVELAKTATPDVVVEYRRLIGGR